jgi:hypothetical protein
MAGTCFTGVGGEEPSGFGRDVNAPPCRVARHSTMGVTFKDNFNRVQVDGTGLARICGVICRHGTCQAPKATMVNAEAPALRLPRDA